MTDEEKYQDILDEMVTEHFDRAASAVNSEGSREQILFLCDELGPEEFLKEFTKRSSE